MTQADQVNRRTFRRNISVFAFALFIFCLAATGGARAADPNLWTVTGVSGKARVLTGGTAWMELGKGMLLQPGNRVETGRDGRISLVRPGDSLTVSPNSRFEIPTAGKTGTVAHLKQALGTLLFKITTRPENPFNVKTPYLTAVIKGTTFTVSVDRARAALHVAEGAVEVTSSISGQTVLVNPGQTAISHRGAGNLRLTGNSSRGGAKAARKSSAAPSKATSGPGASPSALNEAASGSSTAPPSGKSGFILRSLGAGRINIFQVTKGLVNDGNRPDRRGNPKSRSGANPSLAATGAAGSPDTPRPEKFHANKDNKDAGLGGKAVASVELGGGKDDDDKKVELGGKDDHDDKKVEFGGKDDDDDDKDHDKRARKKASARNTTEHASA